MLATGGGLLSLLVYVVIIGLIFWLVWWFVDYVALQDPFNKVVKVILGLVALIFLINVLLSLAGHPMAIGRW